MTPSVCTEDGKSSKLQTLLMCFHSLRAKGALKKTGSSYISLFRPLQDIQSRVILFSGIVLAISAGAPLPIIGVIFSKIINVFPPSEDEIRTRIYQLLAVGELVNIHFLPIF